MNLENFTPNRKLPAWQAIELTSRVPLKILRQVRDYHVNVTDDMINEMLDHIGVDAMADMVSQGCLIYDLATALDIPITKLKKWIDSDHSRSGAIEYAERLSAEAYISTSTRMVMDVSYHDVDAAKVVKMKSSHLNWLAKIMDRDKFSDQVNHKHSGGTSVEYRITFASQIASTETSRVIDVN
jgi:hypothetical protein